MYWIVALFTFIVEIVLFYGLGRIVWLYARIRQLSPKWLWVVIIVATAIVLWGLFMSPNAHYRLNLWIRIGVVFLAPIFIGTSLIRLGDIKIGWTLLTVGTALLTVGQYIIET